MSEDKRRSAVMVGHPNGGMAMAVAAALALGIASMEGIEIDDDVVVRAYPPRPSRRAREPRPKREIVHFTTPKLLTKRQKRRLRGKKTGHA